VSRTQPRPSGCSNTCWNKSTQIAPCARWASIGHV